jgi:hypothetical protein
MLRLVHTQTQSGALLVDDIDDGLPNKTAHRMGSVADPNAYSRDGYANKPKQPCYIPRVKPTDVTIAGYIDLEESTRVLHSAGGGKIAGLQAAALITVVSFVESDLDAPIVTAAALAAGDLTVDGTSFLSVNPEITTVQMWGATVGGTEAAPAITLTTTQIIAVLPGAASDVQIIIDATLLGALAIGDNVTVRADAQTSNTFVVT